MKSLRALCLVALAATAQAADTTAPTLDIQHAWIEKISGKITFRMLLDPKDDTGFASSGAIQFRSKLNSTAPLPDNTPWNTYPWARGTPFEIAYNCTSVIFEVRAIDAAGNTSPLQRRTFATPFPLGTAPNLNPKLVSALPFAGTAIDCRGLFSMDFDGQGVGDDIMQIDRTTGRVDVRLQGAGGNFTISTLQLTAGTINDSAVADFNADGRPDLAVVVDNTLKVFFNAGLVGENLMFTETPPAGLATTGISTVLHCVVGDITGEGKPDIVISGTGDDGQGGTRTKIAWLLNNDQFQLAASNYALPNTDTAAGLLGVGDVNGDGWADVVMTDPDNDELVLFYNRGNGSLAGDDEVTEALQPDRSPTGYILGGLPAQSLAVGDVTGDGRADAVVTLHYFGVVGSSSNPSDTRDHQYFQLFEGRPSQSLNGLFGNTPSLVGDKGPVVASSTPFKSHVILQDLTEDRFPEIVVTSRFPKGATTQPAGGVEAIRVIARLNEVNLATSLEFIPASYNTGVAHPHRLAAGRFNTNDKRDILVANDGNPPLCWVFNVYSPLTKTVDIQGGASTSSDLGGTLGPNDIYSYYEYPGGGSINYTVNYTNNSATGLLNATIECALPAEFQPVLTAMDGGTISGSGSSRVIRWTETVDAYSAGVKSFQVRLLSTAKVGASLAPKISLKQGSKTLASSTQPVVKVAAPNLTVVPASPGQPWSFTFKPFVIPSGILVTGLLQTSVNGLTWTSIPMGIMSLSDGVYTRTETNVPTTARYFRAALFSEAGYKYSSVFSNILPPTTDLRVQTKSPPKTGQTWTFSATQPSTAANVSVRFQSTTTPYVEGSWTDLPAYSATVRAANKWTSNTYNLPSGALYFRAISAAPGWVDSISNSMVGPVNVEQTPPTLPPFTYYHIDFQDPARNGKAAAFMATCPAVLGLKVRFQTRLLGEDDSAWTNLTDGQTTISGTKWTFMTTNMPVGNREWRPVASAPGYADSSKRTSGANIVDAIYNFTVLPAPLPQIPTIFGSFTAPADGSVQRTSVNFPVSIQLFDFNGVQKVSLESAKPGAAFKAVPVAVSNPGGGINYSTTVQFTGEGPLMLRWAVVDGFDPSATCYSEVVTITVGPGTGGMSGPNFVGYAPNNYIFANTFKQATLTSRGSIQIKVRIGDDAKVRRAYVHRMSASDVYLDTVGEMTRASTANPSDFTCTDTNMYDGDYYYRVVAHDYDNNETISGSIGPYTVTTPEPPQPPAPIHLDIVPASRFVAPTIPATGNYKYMPTNTSGKIVFNYSGLPAGSTRFVSYRTNPDTDFVYTEKTVKTRSGTITFNAPYWEAGSQNNNGEGEYIIKAYQGGEELTIGTGVNTFRVGHAWNLPNTFTELDYGLYWFKDKNNGLKGYSSSQRDEYFNPDKPTVIYVHGWQPGEVKVRRRESWLRQDHIKEATTYDMCDIWKKKGYNVGLFNWNQFGNDELLGAQSTIYYIPTHPGLPAGHSLIRSTLDSNGETSKKYYYAGHGGDIEGKTVTDIFLDELDRCMGGYVPHEEDKEFRMIGHSLGTQLVGRTCDAIRKNPGWGIPLPTRVSLLELAQINGLDPRGINIHDEQKAYLKGLKDNYVAIDIYQSTDLQSILGINLAFVGDIHDMCAYSRWRPDFITPINWSLNVFEKSVLLSVFQKSHNEIPRWYMQSFKYPANTFQAWVYRGANIFSSDQHVGNALSASTSFDDVRDLMYGNYYYEQSEGKNTPKDDKNSDADFKDDRFERKVGP